MSRKMQVLAATLACLIRGTLTASTATASAVHFVSISPDVRIELVDWGGSGPPLVLLAGSGDTAHIYDDFAPKLTNEFHVYGITRRGYGASSAPATGYSADRLGDDVVAVLDALHLYKPLLVGHSLAGEEISSIATRHSSRIAGAVYMDAALPFAYQNPEYPEHSSDFEALQAELSKLAPMSAPTSADTASFPAFQKWLAKMLGVQFPISELKATLDTDAAGHITKQKTGSTITEATHKGEERFTSVPVPALAIFAIPHSFGAVFDTLPRSTRDAFEAKEVTASARWLTSFNWVFLLLKSFVSHTQTTIYSSQMSPRCLQRFANLNPTSVRTA